MHREKVEYANRHQEGKCRKVMPSRITVPTSPARTTADMKRRCILHLTEVSFCCEDSFASKLTEKHRQQALILKSLTDEGWKVNDNKSTVLLFGHAGTGFHSCSQVLTDLGVLGGLANYEQHSCDDFDMSTIKYYFSSSKFGTR